MRILKDGECATAAVLNRPHFDRGLVKLHSSEFNNIKLDTTNINLTGSGSNLVLDGKIKINDYTVNVPNMNIFIKNEDTLTIAQGGKTPINLPYGALAAIPNSFYENGEMTASNAQTAARFGSAVAVDGTRLVVGAGDEDTDNIDAGKVYVYEWNGTTYDEVATITASDAQMADRFGTAVALDGKMLVVGAIGEDTNGVDSGKVYVYEWKGTAYVNALTLTASDADAYDRFGTSIALDGTRLVVGAWGEDTAGVNAGKVYVYDWNGTSYVEVGTLTASDAQQNDSFGSSVALDGTRLVVGANNEDTAGFNTGKVYIYDWNGTTYDEVGTLTASDAHVNDSFGTSVSLDGTRLIVGAYYQDTAGNNAGKVYIYDWNGTTYVEVGTLTASDAQDIDYFGWSVALDGTRLVVGAYNEDTAGNNAGKVYIYDEIVACRIAKHDIASGTHLDDANSFYSPVLAKEGIVFLEAWKEDVSGQNAVAHIGGFVQSSQLGTAVAGTYYDAQINQAYANAKAVTFNSASNEDRKQIADSSIIFYDGYTFEQLKFRIRVEYGVKSTKVSDFVAQGSSTTINGSTYVYDSDLKCYKASANGGTVYALEIARINL